MRLGLVAVLASALLGCPSTPPPACIVVDTSCAPLYEPTFDKVYNMTLKTSCGSTKNSCHSAAGRKGGMSFATEQLAYEALLDGRVTPGDPGCSKMVVRTNSPGADYQMPIGDALSGPEQCALVQWVQAGAPGPGVALPIAGDPR